MCHFFLPRLYVCTCEDIWRQKKSKWPFEDRFTVRSLASSNSLSLLLLSTPVIVVVDECEIEAIFAEIGKPETDLGQSEAVRMQRPRGACHQNRGEKARETTQNNVWYEMIVRCSTYYINKPQHSKCLIIRKIKEKILWNFWKYFKKTVAFIGK